MGKAKAPKKSDDEKAAEKAAKAHAKALADFLKAAKAGDCGAIASALAAGVPVDHANERGQTAAHYAAAFGHRKLIKLLHASGADFSLRTLDHNRFTPRGAAEYIGEAAAAQLIDALLAGTAVDMSADDSDDADDADAGASASASGTGQLVAMSEKGKRRQARDEAAPAAALGNERSTARLDDAGTAKSERQPVDVASHVMEERADVQTPDGDPRVYRWLRLRNDMQVMLVSDPSCEYAAAAMDVGVGSSSEPEQLPGLAHFVEHMLFLGTTKYPREDEYTSFLEMHGGESNAFTAHENTHYFFDVHHAHLVGAIDRFAQFFLAPTFTEDAAERELRAVDSEFSKNRHADAWRMQQIIKWAADPRHPWARFNAGNLSTLSERPCAPVAADGRVQLKIEPASDGGVQLTIGRLGTRSVREELLDFHRYQYSSNRMCLAVLGREPIDELIALVAPLFSAVRNLQLPSPSWPHPPYPDERLGRYLRIVPVKEHELLTLTWPLPATREQYLSKPSKYISHILGHEGPGSLLSLLKRLGLAEELIAGETQSHSDFATFIVTVTLTEAGSARVDEVVPLVFSCLAMIAAHSPPPRWVFDELASVSHMRLRFADPIEPSQAVLHLSQELGRRVPSRHALVASFLYEDWAPDQVVTLLTLLSPRRMIVQHVSPRHARVADQREPWYGTAFAVESVGEALLAACETPPTCTELRWPEPNLFIPTDFRLVCDALNSRPPPTTPLTRLEPQPAPPPAPAAMPGASADDECASTLAAALKRRGVLSPPRLMRDDALVELWHKVDATYRRPKTCLHLDVTAPAAYASPAAAMALQLLVRLWNDDLSEFAYAAEIAGLTYAVRRHTQGFSLVVEGHSHKLPLLVARILEWIAQPHLDGARLAVLRAQERRSLTSWFRAEPREAAQYAAAHLLERRRWHALEYMAVLDSPDECGVAQLMALHEALANGVRLSAFCHGNTHADDALEIARHAAEALGGRPMCADESPDPRCLELRGGEEVVLRTHASLLTAEHAGLANADETNSAVELILQAERDGEPSSQLVAMLARVLSGPAFETLRTVEQLGYVVDLGVWCQHGVCGLRVLVQSGSHAPPHLEDRIEAFLATVPRLLAEMADDDYASHRDTLVRAWLEPPTTLQHEAALFWTEISRSTYDFAHSERAAAAAAALTKQDLVRYWAKHFDAHSAERRKLVSHAYAPKHKLPTKVERGIGGRRRVYVDGLHEALAFKQTLDAFPPPPRQPKTQGADV